MTVYSNKGVLSGDKIVSLISQNKEMFTVAISEVTIGELLLLSM